MQELHAVNVLGTEYKIILTTEKEDPRLKELNGCCDQSTKEILIEKDIPEDDHSLRDFESFRRRGMNLYTLFFMNLGYTNNVTGLQMKKLLIG